MEATDLGTAAAAQLLGVHPDTLTRWADAGLIPCWRTPGGHRRFTRADLETVRQTPRVAP